MNVRTIRVIRRPKTQLGKHPEVISKSIFDLENEKSNYLISMNRITSSIKEITTSNDKLVRAILERKRLLAEFDNLLASELEEANRSQDLMDKQTQRTEKYKMQLLHTTDGLTLDKAKSQIDNLLLQLERIYDSKMLLEEQHKQDKRVINQILHLKNLESNLIDIQNKLIQNAQNLLQQLKIQNKKSNIPNHISDKQIKRFEILLQQMEKIHNETNDSKNLTNISPSSKEFVIKNLKNKNQLNDQNSNVLYLQTKYDNKTFNDQQNFTEQNGHQNYNHSIFPNDNKSDDKTFSDNIKKGNKTIPSDIENENKSFPSDIKNDNKKFPSDIKDEIGSEDKRNSNKGSNLLNKRNIDSSRSLSTQPDYDNENQSRRLRKTKSVNDSKFNNDTKGNRNIKSSRNNNNYNNDAELITDPITCQQIDENLETAIPLFIEIDKILGKKGFYTDYNRDSSQGLFGRPGTALSDLLSELNVFDEPSSKSNYDFDFKRGIEQHSQSARINRSSKRPHDKNHSCKTCRGQSDDVSDGASSEDQSPIPISLKNIEGDLNQDSKLNSSRLNSEEKSEENNNKDQNAENNEENNNKDQNAENNDENNSEDQNTENKEENFDEDQDPEKNNEMDEIVPFSRTKHHRKRKKVKITKKRRFDMRDHMGEDYNDINSESDFQIPENFHVQPITIPEELDNLSTVSDCFKDCSDFLNQDENQPNNFFSSSKERPLKVDETDESDHDSVECSLAEKNTEISQDINPENEVATNKQTKQKARRVDRKNNSKMSNEKTQDEKRQAENNGSNKDEIESLAPNSKTRNLNNEKIDEKIDEKIEEGQNEGFHDDKAKNNEEKKLKKNKKSRHIDFESENVNKDKTTLDNNLDRNSKNSKIDSKGDKNEDHGTNNEGHSEQCHDAKVECDSVQNNVSGSNDQQNHKSKKVVIIKDGIKQKSHKRHHNKTEDYNENDQREKIINETKSRELIFDDSHGTNKDNSNNISFENPSDEKHKKCSISSNSKNQKTSKESHSKRKPKIIIKYKKHSKPQNSASETNNSNSTILNEGNKPMIVVNGDNIQFNFDEKQASKTYPKNEETILFTNSDNEYHQVSKFNELSNVMETLYGKENSKSVSDFSKPNQFSQLPDQESILLTGQPIIFKAKSLGTFDSLNNNFKNDSYFETGVNTNVFVPGRKVGASKTPYTKPFLSGIINRKLKSSNLKMTKTDAEIQIQTLDEEIAILKQKIQERHIIRSGESKLQTNISRYYVSAAITIGNSYEKLNSNTQTQITNNHINKLLRTTSNNSELLNNQFIERERKKLLSTKLKEMRSHLQKQQTAEQKMDESISTMLNQIDPPESIWISPELRTRVRLEAVLKEKREILEQIENENHATLDQMVDIREKINKEREGHEKLKSEISEIRKAPAPDLEKLGDSLQGYKEYQKTEEEKLKIFDLQEKYLDKEIAKFTSLTNPSAISRLTKEVDGLRSQINDRKQRYFSYHHQKVPSERTYKLTNKQELRNLESELQRIVSNIDNLGRREKNAQSIIDNGKKILQLAHITILF